MSFENLIHDLWVQYTETNSHVEKIHCLFEASGELVVNDHIALRTFNHPKVNINCLAKFFTQYGYEEKGEYHFKNKHLYAKHFEYPNQVFPKIFISELLCQDFSESLQQIMSECVALVPDDIVNTEQLLVSGCLWKPISYATYCELLQESEYAAWLYVFGFRANHFTVFINHLEQFDCINDVNALLQDNGFRLNSSGGVIKGSPAELLEQSSTMAQKVEVVFKEGIYEIPCCYYEFAKRYKQDNGNLYQGFVAASADKIFESTDT